MVRILPRIIGQVNSTQLQNNIAKMARIAIFEQSRNVPYIDIYSHDNLPKPRTDTSETADRSEQKRHDSE